MHGKIELPGDPEHFRDPLARQRQRRVGLQRGEDKSRVTQLRRSHHRQRLAQARYRMPRQHVVWKLSARLRVAHVRLHEQEGLLAIRSVEHGPDLAQKPPALAPAPATATAPAIATVPIPVTTTAPLALG